MDENFNLRALQNLMRRMLRATEETKRTLQMECEEAKFALKPWPIETVAVRQLDENICTCEEGLTSESKAEEIAAEIGKTLLHSQQLREKLAANLHKERQNARKPDVREIYSSGPKRYQPPKESNGSSAKTSLDKENNSRNERPRRSLSQQRPIEKKDETRKLNRFRSASTVRSRETNENVAGRRARLTGKMVLEPSKDNVLAQMTMYKPKPQTNFILANKLSVRYGKTTENNKQSQSKSQVDLRKVGVSAKPPVKTSNKSTSTRNDEVETISEFDRLLKKFNVQSAINSSNLRNNCPIHAENSLSVIEEKVVTSVDAVEGLDRFGVPSPLIKILKTYHAYIKAEVLNETPAVIKKHQEAANNFLENFDRIHQKNKLPQLSKHEDLLNVLSAMCSDVFKSELNEKDLKIVKSKFIALDSLYNECNIKSTAGEIKLFVSNGQVANEFACDMNNWISNGIWNYLSIVDLKDIFGSHSFRYSDRNQLMLFYDLILKVQRKIYETELIEVLLQTVLPKLKEFFHPSSKEYIDLFKMIFIIAQILNPKVPVLAKADGDD